MSDRDIHELQRDCLKRDVPVSDLLRRALVIARTKGDNHLEQWIRSELTGKLQGDQEPPDYRVMQPRVRYMNPVHRQWLPVTFRDGRFAEHFRVRTAMEPIPHIEELLQDPRSREMDLAVDLNEEEQAVLNAACDLPIATRFKFFFPASVLHQIVNGVRDRLLDWTMQFDLNDASPRHSPRARKPAAPTTTIIHGNVQAMQVQIGTANKSQFSASLPIEELRSFLGEVGRIADQVPDSDKQELGAKIAAIQAQLDSPKAKRSVVRACLGALGRVMEKAGGEVLGRLAVRAATLAGLL